MSSALDGKRKNRLYAIWCDMKTRCHNKASVYYHNYGGRGIRICSEWSFNYDAFRAWALSSGYEDHLTIDRINPDGNYEAENCRWATRNQQAANRRKFSGNTTSKFKGVTLRKYDGVWRAYISTGGRKMHLGYFLSEKEAAIAYDDAARKFFGEFAVTNFPKPQKCCCEAGEE